MMSSVTCFDASCRLLTFSYEWECALEVFRQHGMTLLTISSTVEQRLYIQNARLGLGHYLVALASFSFVHFAQSTFLKELCAELSVSFAII